jgi:hypothetical protein
MDCKGMQELRRGSRGILQCGPLTVDGGAHKGGRNGEQAAQKYIGVLGHDPIRRQRSLGKIGKVEGDDHVCPRLYGRSKDMAILRIRQVERLDEMS